MDFDWYQWNAMKFACYPDQYNNATYPALGLTGEAGEVANKVKKMQRDSLSRDEVRPFILDELGDVLWYLAALADEFGLTMDEIAQRNLNKLTDRHRRGTIQGSGDDR